MHQWLRKDLGAGREYPHPEDRQAGTWKGHPFPFLAVEVQGGEGC